MAQRAASPPLAQRRDGTVYLVLDDFDALGRAYRETTRLKPTPKRSLPISCPANIDRHPLRVVAFNTAEGWARDVSADIARQVLTRALEFEQELPAAVRDFVERACA
jgi:hypothetical protein